MQNNMATGEKIKNIKILGSKMKMGIGKREKIAEKTGLLTLNSIIRMNKESRRLKGVGVI